MQQLIFLPVQLEQWSKRVGLIKGGVISGKGSSAIVEWYRRHRSGHW